MPRLTLLTNPTAGKGRGARVRPAVARRLRDAGYDVEDLVAPGAEEALELARSRVSDDARALVVNGGDGMVHLAAQAVAGTGTRLGIIPTGTGNDVARYLGLPRTDPLAAAERVVAGRTRTLDLARSGDRWFVTVLAAGFDAVVNERANRMTWPKGQMRYNLATLSELRTLSPIPYTLELDGRTVRVDAVTVAVANGPSFGGGLRIAEAASVDDGLLDVVVIGPISRRRLVALYPRLFNGTIDRAPEYEVHRARSVTVAAPGITAYADGERFGALPLTVACVPGALTVFT